MLHFLKRRPTIALLIVIGLAVVASGALVIWKAQRPPQVTIVTGAVLAANPDPHKQRPVQNATIVAECGEMAGKAVSDTAGFFRLRLDCSMAPDESIKLRLQHPDYQAFATTTSMTGEQLHVIRLKPTDPQEPEPPQKQVTIADARVRYATKSTSIVNVGTVVRTFEIVNKGNVPCNGKPPCSPDGKWKASFGSITVDTGEDNKTLRNARVSCIAGPCPFTSIESDEFSRGGRKISVVVRNWSDRVTYLLEAEVAHTMQSDMIRHTYPVTFGRSMNFTLPASAQGPSIEAEVDGAEIVFPLGPSLKLSWANCRLEVGSDGTKQYRCELKPGFRFK